MAEDPDAGQPREIWVQDLADRNLFHNRILDLTWPEASLQDRPNQVIKIMYDRAPAHELPFAYFWAADEQIGVDPVEGDAVRFIFDLHGRGFSAEKIARRLEDTPHPRTGGTWHSGQIRKILADESTYRTGVLGSDSSLHLPSILK